MSFFNHVEDALQYHEFLQWVQLEKAMFPDIPDEAFKMLMEVDD